MYFSCNDRAKFHILVSYFLPAGLINKPGMFDHSGLKVAGVTEDFFLRWKFFQTKGYVNYSSAWGSADSVEWASRKKNEKISFDE